MAQQQPVPSSTKELATLQLDEGKAEQEEEEESEYTTSSSSCFQETSIIGENTENMEVIKLLRAIYIELQQMNIKMSRIEKIINNSEK